ncbi:carboxylesterase family protein-like protein [Dendryphion nanum]|uniref:Carboxylic ester hydrolase n=1 Tax=Dendryphion nanum TaxID=256645 RepID=A0A9P9I7Z8_9PLEO|nr:carboxylesterase family protein-like protein [Dendryphion nanum]
MFKLMNKLALASFALIYSAAVAAYQRLPIVDLGYELHQAASFNNTGGYYNFTNIRYAAPPLGNLRFAPPQPPAMNRSVIETGNTPRICPQAPTGWISTALPLMSQYTAGLSINVSSNSAADQLLPPIDPRTTEDCLFLDVMVPKRIFEAAEDGRGAPVLVWIYGGGYTAGEKATTPLSNPGGLLRRSNDTMIFVALNYRLGAFGWLSGPTFQQDSTPNVGLYDQRLALEWVQENIAKFGGDPKRVTVMGESAGAGSIIHQITAYGGQEGKGAQVAGAPFSQAILQSPGWLPHPPIAEQDRLFNDFLARLNVSTLQEARLLSTEALVRANMAVVRDSSYGTFSFGPTVDGDFVPAIPAVSLLDGRFDPNVTIMVGHNPDEGVLFTPPNATNVTTFVDSILALYPSMTQENLDYVAKTLYPAVFNGAHGYTDPYRRAAKMRADVIIVCNKLPVLTAYQQRAYSYQFSLPPGLHGVDLEYTFYDDGGAGPFNPATLSGVVSEEAAHTFQRWIAEFVTSGEPKNVNRLQSLPYPGNRSNASTVDLNVTGVSIITEYAAGRRCAFWESLDS